MKLPARFAVATGWALLLSDCATPPDAATSRHAGEPLYGEVHTELTPYADDLVQQPAPAYPVGPRGERAHGIGVFRIQFDYEAGRATTVTILNSTGDFALDQAALGALRRWTIKPRTWDKIDVLIRFAAPEDATSRISSGRRQFSTGAPTSFRPPHSRPP